MILELIAQPYFYLKRNNINVWNKCLTLLSPSYFEVYQAQGGGGAPPLQNLDIFLPIAIKFGTDVKQVMI